MAKMNEKEIAKQCKKNGYYSTPELNEQLHLHFAGYDKIENLEAFTECRVLWLESNAIARIENLESMHSLRTLHLDHNCLHDLDGCVLPLLQTLNVSFNFISSLSGLSNFPLLERLYLANNDITDGELRHLAHVAALQTLDLAKNKLSDPEALLAALATLPKLMSLNLSGNEVVRNLPHYRRRMICALPALCQLDDMPIFEDERRRAEAWGRGGREAERAEMAAIEAEKTEQRKAQRRFFENLINEARSRGSTAGTETSYARTMRLAEEETAAKEFARSRPKSALSTPPTEPAVAGSLRTDSDGSGEGETDDDDIAVPTVSVDTPTKRLLRRAGPQRAQLHADPTAGLSDGDAAATAEAAPDVPELSEADVLECMQLDADTSAQFAAVAEPSQADASPGPAPADAETAETTDDSAAVLRTVMGATGDDTEGDNSDADEEIFVPAPAAVE